ncbi:MAG: HDOD domain-containing protein [Desulfobulbus sp.]|jgi:HD-like signal output (HDOD) protein|uniref:HDOD domain-containing protein n=1 Tax=Desulfobulbus sp. TaxID=895 RepID=UPI00284129C4|nr:HDOD domain-containing protein [Desulfobulbus sp.]MDR2548712.1 HDOD domain-containing protein [Desulfobulbus sp.]
MVPLLHDVLRAAHLLSLPDIYIRLRQVLDNPEYTVAEVAAVIEKDPAMTLRLLRMVNSSLYSFAARVDSVGRAVTLLGSQQIHDLVLATSIGLTFKGISSNLIDMQRFWRRSVHCAAACQHLAARVGECGRERLFVAGLLHDIGHLLMYQAIPGLAQQALVRALADGQPVYMAERSLLGFDYAVVGGELMRLWELPESLVELVRCHLEPERAQHHPVETALVHLGALLAGSEQENGMFDEGALAAAPRVWTATGLSPEECLAMRETIKHDFEAITQFFS